MAAVTDGAAVRYPFTAPMVRPDTKYFWKKGYAQAMGSTETITMAIRMVSLGRLAEASTPILSLLRVRKVMLSSSAISTDCSGKPGACAVPNFNLIDAEIEKSDDDESDDYE